MYCGQSRLCVSVCLCAAACAHYCTDPDVTWVSGMGLPPSYALFAIGARVALLWQHNANPSYKLASTPRYDDIARKRNVSECSVLALCLVTLVVDLLLCPQERLRSIVMTMSVCVSVCLSASIHPEQHARSLPIFCACCLCPWLGLPPAR